MTYLFDASSIYKLVVQGKALPLVDGITITLAPYELGNIVWKEHLLHKALTYSEAAAVLETINGVVDKMAVVNIVGRHKEILEVASKNSVSFYDASYIVIAKQTGSTLVTEDGSLAKKAMRLMAVRNSDQLYAEREEGFGAFTGQFKPFTKEDKSGDHKW